MRRIVLLCAGFCFVPAGSPLEVGSQSPQDATVTASYPDSTSGLERLVKDILKAQKSGDGVRAQQLIDSLILPDYQNWYSAEFDEETAAAGIASYKAGSM